MPSRTEGVPSSKSLFGEADLPFVPLDLGVAQKNGAKEEPW